MICPANKVDHPAKVVWPTTLFSNSKHFFMTFMSAIGQLTPCGGGLKQSTFYDYIIHLITDLNWNINCYG